MSTLGWSVSEKDTEWKLASEVTWRGEKLMLRTATVRGWQPHPGALSRACWATLPRVLMTGILVATGGGEEKLGQIKELPCNWTHIHFLHQKVYKNKNLHLGLHVKQQEPKHDNKYKDKYNFR